MVLEEFTSVSSSCIMNDVSTTVHLVLFNDDGKWLS